MFIEHRSHQPRVHHTAWVAPSAVISGDVEVGPETRVLDGAVLTAEGAPVRIGRRCVIMEHAVIRASGGRARSFPAIVGDDTLIGPHTYLSGCTVEDRCFIATSAIIFNGAQLGRGCEVMLQGIVHIGTTLEPGTIVPVQHIAIGTPARIFSPVESLEMRAALTEQNFWRYVFDIEPEDRPLDEIIAECLARYSGVLRTHRQDRLSGRSELLGD